MKYIHKYSVEGETFYRVTDKASKPSGPVMLRQDDWAGKALGRFDTVIDQLNNLKFNRKEEKKEEKEEKKGKKACISDVVLLKAQHLVNLIHQSSLIKE